MSRQSPTAAIRAAAFLLVGLAAIFVSVVHYEVSLGSPPDVERNTLAVYTLRGAATDVPSRGVVIDVRGKWVTLLDPSRGELHVNWDHVESYSVEPLPVARATGTASSVPGASE